ncbi:MAG: DUF2721 domain-containing protein [Burkholderiales bacterium]
MQPPEDIITVAHAIQQAVAPVFLLTGVGAILSVLSVRLGRLIDRCRMLREMDADKQVSHEPEMKNLLRRVKWIHSAISLCTTCALFICIVISALFIGAELGKDPSSTISLFFIVAMLSLIAGLLCFLREIALATNNLK